MTDYQRWDHERLGAILKAVVRQVDAGQLKQARELYRDFDIGVRRHVRLEQELLYPLFEARSGITAGPTYALRQEHDQVRQAVRMMREGLTDLDVEVFRQGARYLAETLPDHNSREEHVLYPMMDQLLSDDERRALSERLQRE